MTHVDIADVNDCVPLPDKLLSMSESFHKVKVLENHA
jgi:hypothetical protein